MKKTLLLLALPFVFLATLTAQITQVQADEIVINRMSDETKQHIIFAKEVVQMDGYTVITSKNEMLELDYSCFVYYIKYNEGTNGKYLIVKESNGNLLEVNLKDAQSSLNFAEWRWVNFSNMNATIHEPCKSVYNIETSRMNKGSIQISYIDGELFIEHYDARINCGYEVINVATSYKNDPIDIYYWEEPDDADCYCKVDFSYSAGKFEPGTYRLVIHHFMNEVYNQIIILE